MKKILIIEDDEAIRSELQKILTNSGYEAQITDTFERTNRKNKTGFNSDGY